MTLMVVGMLFKCFLLCKVKHVLNGQKFCKIYLHAYMCLEQYYDISPAKFFKSIISPARHASHLPRIGTNFQQITMKISTLSLSSHSLCNCGNKYRFVYLSSGDDLPAVCSAGESIMWLQLPMWKNRFNIRKEPNHHADTQICRFSIIIFLSLILLNNFMVMKHRSRHFPMHWIRHEPQLRNRDH